MGSSVPSSRTTSVNRSKDYCLETLRMDSNNYFKNHENQNNGFELEKCDKIKLEYLKYQLTSIACDKYLSTDSDQGYGSRTQSQNNFESESTLIKAVALRIAQLKDEKNNLLLSIEDISAKLNYAIFKYETVSQITNENKRIFKTIANHLSIVCGTEISIESILFDVNDDLPIDQQKQQPQRQSLEKCKFCSEPTPFCEPINKINQMLYEKEREFEKIRTTQFEMQNNFNNISEEMDAKDNIINNLQLQRSDDMKMKENMSLDLSALLKSCVDKQKEFEQLTADNSQQKENLIKMSRQHIKLEEQYKKVYASEQQLKCKIAVLEKNTTNRNSAYDSLCDELNHCKEQLRVITSQCKHGEANVIDEYQILIEMFQTKDYELRQVQQNAEMEKQVLGHKILNLEANTKNYKLKIDDLNDKIGQKQLEIDEITSCLKVTEELNKKLKNDLEKEHEMHNKQNSKLKSDLLILRQHMDKQHQAITKQNADMFQLEKQIVNFDKQYDINFKQKVALQNQLSSLKENLICSRHSEQKLKGRVFELELDLSNTVQKMCELIHYKESNELNMNARNNFYNEKIEGYNKLIEEYNIMCKKNSELSVFNRALQAQIKELMN